MGYPIIQDPDDKRNYTVDWTKALNGDTISTSVWTLQSPLTEPFTKSIDATLKKTTVWLAGGLANNLYTVKNKIVTVTDAREMEHTFAVFFKESDSIISQPAAATLFDCRKMLVARSGRFDLVQGASEGNYSDFGANQLLNDAQEFLETLLPHDKRDAILYKELAVGQTIIQFSQARFIQEVWLNAAGKTRFKVEKIDMHRMRTDYTQPQASLENANTPSVWTPYATDPSPENPSHDIEGILLSGTSAVRITATAHRLVTGDVAFFRNVAGTTELNTNTYTITKITDDTFDLDSTDSSDFTAWTSGGSATKMFTNVTDTDVLALGDTFAEKSILIMPPSDIAYTVEVLCAWRSPKLTNDTHRSFWTVNKPALLVRTAMMLLETDFHRNTQGRRDYELAVKEEITLLYHDLIAEEQAGDQSLWIMNG